MEDLPVGTSSDTTFQALEAALLELSEILEEVLERLALLNEEASQEHLNDVGSMEVPE